MNGKKGFWDDFSRVEKWSFILVSILLGLALVFTVGLMLLGF